jgi:hypothetical protein
MKNLGMQYGCCKVAMLQKKINNYGFGYYIIDQKNQKTSEEFGNEMWVLWDNYVTKCSLTIMDVNITWLAKKINEKFGRLM